MSVEPTAAWMNPLVRAPLPSGDKLRAALVGVVRRHAPAGVTLDAVERLPSHDVSSFPSEVARCTLSHGRHLLLYIKYSGSYSHAGLGHRGGVAHEAWVYEHVLASLPLPTPKWYGTQNEVETGEVWLILEFLNRADRLSKAPGTPLSKAATWAGRLHRNSALLDGDVVSRLPRYDRRYLTQWADRVMAFAAARGPVPTWLHELVEGYRRLLPFMLERPQTVVHGEFYPQNILVSSGVIYPVDWESAAFGPGEIDFASLTQDWPSHYVADASAAYLSERYGGNAPDDFELATDVARLYLELRWLGNRPEKFGMTANRRADVLRTLGGRLGIL